MSITRFLLVLAFLACASGSALQAQRPSNDPSPSTPAPPATTTSATSPLFHSDGTLNTDAYNLFALSWDKAAMEQRLGPSFETLNPGAPDKRPTLYKPASKSRTGSFLNRTNPYELGGPPVTDSDYWSDSGQVGYVPDSASDVGLDRIQTFAYYDRVYAISPRLDYASGVPHPDPQTRDPYYKTLFGEAPKDPIAMVRNYGMEQNEALVLYKDGFLGVVGTQTSRSSSERPYPGFVFPETKVPTAIAVTTENEFALVTVWDLATHHGQLAVFALEGKYLPYHTWPYMGLPNQGSWSNFKLLGYIDLPFATPSSVAAASNGWWSGPSQTGNLVLSQINLALDSARKLVYNGSWDTTVAVGGYAIVASHDENKAVIVDLQPLFHYFHESYLSSAASYQATLKARGPGDHDFPQTFSVRPDIAPRVVTTLAVSQPNAVLAGMKLDRWTKDFYKGYIASQDGTIHIIDTSSLMARFSWERRHALSEIGTFTVGRNPVSMVFTRFLDGNLPLLPSDSTGQQTAADPLNNTFHIACRGDREVVTAVTFGGEGAVYRTIQDKRMGDPVAVSVAVRGNILTVADFHGKKILSFRIGPIKDNRHNIIYGCGPSGTDPFEFAGELDFQGSPFLVNSTNVN